jgi:hypothetical protein
MATLDREEFLLTGEYLLCSVVAVVVVFHNSHALHLVQVEYLIMLSVFIILIFDANV